MRFSRIATIALIGFTLVGYGARCAQAQDTKTPPPADETGVLFDDINDIDKLRVLNPIKLTADQLGKLITLVQDEQKSYNKRVADTTTTLLKPVAKDIKDTRRKLLTGGTIPSEFDDKVKQVQSDLVDKRKKEDAATVNTLVDGVRKIFTADQVTAAIGLARTLTRKAGQDTLKGDNDAFFNYYVIGTFLSYPRIIPLMQDMQKALGENKTGSVAKPLREARR